MKLLCERLLGRSLSLADGIDVTHLSATERRLGAPLPAALHELYLHAGKQSCLMDAFQHFAAPEQLEIEDGKLVFLEENQGVCVWAVDDRTMVSQRANGDSTWHPEDLPLDEFLRIILYYQCAQGGYEHAGTIGLEQAELLALLAAQWEKVVEHNGLTIYWQPDALIWWLQESDGTVHCVFLSARTHPSYQGHAETYLLEEL